MLELIPSDTRGGADHGWLQTRHTFSFADYYNPQRMRFGSLRVMNEDRIAPGQGFGQHPHRDMEILTYPVSGTIEHRDDFGNCTVTTSGEIQRMTAGTGVQHSEYNHSDTDELHLLQIWIFPEQKNLEPGYEQKAFSREDKLDRLCLIASRDGRDNSVVVHQQVDVYASVLQKDAELQLAIGESHKVFVQTVRGEIAINGQHASTRDGLQISGEDRLAVKAQTEAEILVFDMG